MNISLDLSQFKSAGVYTIETDQSASVTVATQTLKLVPGFSAYGPFNAPVFITSEKDLSRFYGNIDTKLERKGSFFHRSIQTSLLTSPVFALNLLNVDADPNDGDKVNFGVLSLNSDLSNDGVGSDLYVNFFNRERFWKPNEDYLQGVANNFTSANNDLSGPLISIVNLGTKTISFIVRKAVGIQGYGVTAQNWYGRVDNIPYEWIRSGDLIQDYFIQVIAIEGNWTNYSNLSTDSYYSTYFNTNGLIPSQINNFINSNNVNLIGSWTGCIIPNFKDQTDSDQYIETIVNASTSLTGVFMRINQDALDQLVWDSNSDQWEIGDSTSTTAAKYLIDLVGHNLITDNSVNVSSSFMSYSIDASQNVFHTDVSVSALDTSGKLFSIDSSLNDSIISIGSFVKAGTDIQPGVTRIINKYFDNGSYVFETQDPVYNYINSPVSVTIQKNIEDPSVNIAYKFIKMNGLKILNKHIPGFDTNGARDAEAGVSKIYKMLDDEGISRGLTNQDMINYRYIVDTMAYGLRPNLGGKSYLSSLAKKRGKTTAIINAPSMKQFAAAQSPYFCKTYVPGADPTPIFDTKYISEGGNPDMPRSFKFTLPTEELGSKYAGVFGPFLTYTDNNKSISVPPAADVANAFTLKFLGGDPYAIVANKNGILSNPYLTGVEYKLDKTDRDYLEPFGYNAIIERPSSNQIMIYGDNTAYQNVKSEFNNLHVRELLNTVELQIADVLKNYVFDFNNFVTRLNIINSISPILETVKDAGAIQKYTLVMDETNNTNDIIKEGFGIVDINLWITGALKQIIARYNVFSDGSISSGGTSLV